MFIEDIENCLREFGIGLSIEVGSEIVGRAEGNMLTLRFRYFDRCHKRRLWLVVHDDIFDSCFDLEYSSELNE